MTKKEAGRIWRLGIWRPTLDTAWTDGEIISCPYEEPYYFDRMMSELELLKIYLESVLDEEALAYLDGGPFLYGECVPGAGQGRS